MTPVVRATPVTKSEFIDRVRAGHSGAGAADKLASGDLVIEVCRCSWPSCRGWRLHPTDWKAVDLR